MKEILKTQSTQVLENLTGIALANGFKLPKDIDRKAWAERKLRPDLVSNKYVTKFLDSLLETNKIREYFVKQLKRTLEPIKYGIQREWKQTQKEALEAIIDAFEQWYTRPLIEVPTGIGKSMLWGAIVRSYYDTLRKFGLLDTHEIVLFTSRIHIADQMIGVSLRKSSENEIEDEPLEYGDVKMWLPKLSDNDIRILAGRSSSSKEAKKNAVLTIACYQGLSPKTLNLLYTREVGLGILDESHRATNRVRIVLDNKMHTAFFIGGSATTKGPAMNNPFKFFEAVERGHNEGRAASYQERLAYYASILDCIERRELKPVRYINVRTGIDLSSLPAASRNLPEKAAGKLIAKNVPLMKQLLEELFLGDYPVLKVVGSKAVIDRKWLVFVERIKIAEKLAEYCNTELRSLLVKKYGKRLQFKADYVSGAMSANDFNDRMINYRNNTTTIMFSSDKLGEGADVPEINGVFSLRAYSARALWKAIQEMGRGVRHIEGEDLLMVDGIFKSQKHEIASALTVFGVNSYVNGGLVAGYSGERDAETKVLTLLKDGMTWKEVWGNLTKAEKELVPFIRQYLGEMSGDSQAVANYEKPFSIKSIEFVENEGLKLKKNYYSTWQEASVGTLAMGIRTWVGYKKRYKEDVRLPSNPPRFYPDFPGKDAFFGKKKRIFYSTWQEASSAATIAGITTSTQYFKIHHIADVKLPGDPSRYYFDFPGWGTFLNTQRKPRQASHCYSTWQQASRAARRLGIKTGAEYRKKYKKDLRLPSDPLKFYPDFPGLRQFLSKKGDRYSKWQEASDASIAIGIESSSKYPKKYKKDGRLPSAPQYVYKNFPGWDKFLGKE